MEYVAIFGDNVILPYVTEGSMKKKMLKRLKNKSHRIERGNKSFKILEEWLIYKNKSTLGFKVNINMETYYFKDMESAMNKLGRGCRVLPLKDITNKIDEDIDEKIENLSEYLESNLETLREFSNSLQSMGEHLSNKVSQKDLEFEDIKHAVEFEKLEMEQGYRMYLLMHETLRERRRYKDALAKVCILTDNGTGDYIKGLVTKLDNLENRRYYPRILKNLFQYD